MPPLFERPHQTRGEFCAGSTLQLFQPFGVVKLKVTQEPQLEFLVVQKFLIHSLGAWKETQK